MKMTMDNVSYLDFGRAARENDLPIVQKCTRKDTNKRNEDGMTPVHWAAAYGNLEALRILIGKGLVNLVTKFPLSRDIQE